MNCRKCRERLERFLDNELSGTERTALEQHLAVCAGCRKRTEELKALGALLQSRTPAEPEPGFLAGFNDRFWHEVKRRRRMQSIEPGRGFFAFGWNRMLATAAAALLLVAVGFVRYRSCTRLSAGRRLQCRRRRSSENRNRGVQRAKSPRPKPAEKAQTRTGLRPNRKRRPRQG